MGAPSSGHRVTALLPQRTRPLAAEAPGCGQELGFRAGTRSITRHGEQDLELGDIILGDTGLARDSRNVVNTCANLKMAKRPVSQN